VDIFVALADRRTFGIRRVEWTGATGSTNKDYHHG